MNLKPFIRYYAIAAALVVLFNLAIWQPATAAATLAAFYVAVGMILQRLYEVFLNKQEDRK